MSAAVHLQKLTLHGKLLKLHAPGVAILLNDTVHTDRICFDLSSLVTTH